MHNMNNSKAKKLMAGIMIIMVLVVMLFWTSHEAAHICHKCTGNDCPICALLHQCENAFSEMGGDLAADADLDLSPVLFACILPIISIGIKRETPVSRKVRLDN